MAAASRTGSASPAPRSMSFSSWLRRPGTFCWPVTSVAHAGARARRLCRSAVGPGGEDACVVQKVGPGVAAVASDVGVGCRPERQVGAEEGPEAGTGVEVAGGGGAEQPDEGRGDEPAADGTEIEAVRGRLGFGEDVVPQRGADRERPVDAADVGEICGG